MTSSVLTFGRVFVIESIEGGFASRTGYGLVQNLGGNGLYLTPPIAMRYLFIQSRQELDLMFKEIEDECRKDQVGPLLHFEMHGDKAHGHNVGSGIQLADGDIVDWSYLSPALARLNHFSRFNLVVFMAACFGLGLTRALAENDRAPMRLIFGFQEEVKSGTIETATTAFYTELFKTASLNLAYSAANKAIAPEVLRGYDAPLIFSLLAKGYLDLLSDPEHIKMRIDRRIAAVDAWLTRWESAETNRSQIYEKWRASLAVRSWHRRELMDARAFFEPRHKRFFFIDKLPENAAKFPFIWPPVIG